MPLVDLSDPATFDRYYEKGTNIWLMEHPTTGAHAVWIQGQGPQPFHTKAHLSWEVRVHYVRALELNAARHRAKVLTAAVGLTATDRVAIIGAGFGWLQEALEEQLPGIECVSVETSPWIQGAKDQSEVVELDVAIQAAGILPVEMGYDAAMARLNDGGNKARRELVDEDVISGQGRAKIKAKIKAKGVPVPFTWAVSEHTLEWLDDAEAVDLDAGMHALAPNVCHLLREYDPRQAKHTEPGYKSNWKYLILRSWAVFSLMHQVIRLRYVTQAEADAEVVRLHSLMRPDPDPDTGEPVPVYPYPSFEVRNIPQTVKQELLDLPWYTVDSWQALLNADSVLVGV